MGRDHDREILELRQQLRRWQEMTGTDTPEEAARYRLYTEKIRDVIWTSDLYMKWTYISPQVEDLLGYTADEALTFPPEKTIAPASLALIQAEIAQGLPRVFADPDIMQWPTVFEIEQIHRDGHSIWTEVLVNIVRDREGRPTGYLGITRNIERRRKAEDELRCLHKELEERIRQRTEELQETCRRLAEEIKRREKSEEEKAASETRLKTIMDYMSDAVSMVDREGNYIFNTPSIERLTGWKAEELVGRNFFEVMVHPEDMESMQREMAIGYRSPGRTARIVFRIRHRDGQIRWLETTGWFVPAGKSGELVGICSSRDISDRKRLEGELLKLQKLDSLARLSSGIAHDFNNLLSAMLGNIGLARQVTPVDSRLAESLRRTEEACRHARRLTDQLFSFVSHARPLQENTDIPAFLQDCIEFLLSGSNVSPRWQFEHGLPEISVDRGQLQQVLANIIQNSVQAMPQGGFVDIRVQKHQIDSDDTLPLVPGEYLRISVSDQGEGIPDAHLSRIFDPYFSTRPRSRGLGLSCAFGIIRGHGGHISVESQPGTGACFHIDLPRISLPAQPRQTPPESLIIRGEKILVMDDDHELQNLIVEMLEAIGYRAEGASSGDEVLSRCLKAREQGDPFSAVLLDLTMKGGAGGPEVRGRLEQRLPGLPVVLMSGYSQARAMEDSRQMGFRGLLLKPFGLPQLQAVMQEILS